MAVSGWTGHAARWLFEQTSLLCADKRVKLLKSQFVYDFWHAVANYLFICASFSLFKKMWMIENHFWIIGLERRENADRTCFADRPGMMCGWKLLLHLILGHKPSYSLFSFWNLSRCVETRFLDTLYDQRHWNGNSGRRQSFGLLPRKSFPFLHHSTLPAGWCFLLYAVYWKLRLSRQPENSDGQHKNRKHDIFLKKNNDYPKRCGWSVPSGGTFSLNLDKFLRNFIEIFHICSNFLKVMQFLQVYTQWCINSCKFRL